MAKSGGYTNRGGIVDLKPHLDDVRIQKLLTSSMGFPTPEKIKKVVQHYHSKTAWKLMGFELDGLITGCIGIEIIKQRQARIRHLAVVPDFQRQGIARSMIQQISDTYGLISISAETDNESLEFYRKTGFTITSLGEKYPGVERFRCELKVKQKRITSSS